MVITMLTVRIMITVYQLRLTVFGVNSVPVRISVVIAMIIGNVNDC